MRQVTITIGRGAVGTPRLLSPERWDAFKVDVKRLLDTELADIVVSSDGTGSWEGENGIAYSEQNHVWIALAPSNVFGFDHVYIREVLRGLAEDYDQDAIALGFGTSELIERKPQEATS